MTMLSPMQFKSFVWPHNPRVYEIRFQRQMAKHQVPFGDYILQSMGRSCRVLRGEGEFIGPRAYGDFKALATLFYENSPGLLTHPLWQSSNAWLVQLQLRQEPREDYVAYSFEFWECCDLYEAGPRQLRAGKTEAQSGIPAPAREEKWYTAVWGDCLWSIAGRNGLSLQQLLALNPQIKNPNLLYVGDRIRIG